jgi:thiosulfate/3-mercaptopyruvate sulfurtransferase
MSRGGHIPGSRNIPFNSAVEDSNKFKSVRDAAPILKAAGVKKRDSVTGQQARLLNFVARYLGFDAHLYHGSSMTGADDRSCG